MIRPSQFVIGPGGKLQPRKRVRHPKSLCQAKRSCRVCSDKASNFNYGAITCESCKAFFRRNADKIKSLKCSQHSDDSQGECISDQFKPLCCITPHSRRLCSLCRLKKCYSVGMRKEWFDVPYHQTVMNYPSTSSSPQSSSLPPHPSSLPPPPKSTASSSISLPPPSITTAPTTPTTENNELSLITLSTTTASAITTIATTTTTIIKTTCNNEINGQYPLARPILFSAQLLKASFKEEIKVPLTAQDLLEVFNLTILFEETWTNYQFPDHVTTADADDVKISFFTCLKYTAEQLQKFLINIPFYENLSQNQRRMLLYDRLLPLALRLLGMKYDEKTRMVHLPTVSRIKQRCPADKYFPSLPSLSRSQEEAKSTLETFISRFNRMARSSVFLHINLLLLKVFEPENVKEFPDIDFSFRCFCVRAFVHYSRLLARYTCHLFPSSYISIFDEIITWYLEPNVELDCRLLRLAQVHWDKVDWSTVTFI